MSNRSAVGPSRRSVLTGAAASAAASAMITPAAAQNAPEAKLMSSAGRSFVTARDGVQI